MEKYWNNAVDFEAYRAIAQDRAENPAEGDDKNEYYDLGVQRMNRTLKTFKVNPDTLAKLKAKNFSGKILILSEPWCGDASATVPAVSKFFGQAGNEVRIFLSDSDPTLIDQFLTNGTRSIPKVLILNQDFTVQNVWGPRPEYGMQLLKKFKANEAAYPREEFYNDLQVYYAKNRGADAIEEIINLI